MSLTEEQRMKTGPSIAAWIKEHCPEKSDGEAVAAAAEILGDTYDSMRVEFARLSAMLTAAESRAQAAEAKVEYWTKCAYRYQDERDSQNVLIGRLRAALKKYGVHSASCRYEPPVRYGPCDCGLADALGPSPRPSGEKM